MRKIALLFSTFALGATMLQAQTVATFDSLYLPTTDTFYVNHSAPSTDVGFDNGLAHFSCIYDSSGGFWYWTGFLYSNKTDSVTSGFANEYSAKTAIGIAGSPNYAILYCSNPLTYANNYNLNLIGAAIGKPVSGFYITNTTYAYNSMLYGDAFPGKKFGGTTGNDPDWFKLVVKGYRSGTLTPDSVEFYLADYRFASHDSDYIVKTWEWVNLLPLGHVDSLQFSLSSSDTGSFGMNTPSYFCLDNFTTNETAVSINNNPNIASSTKIYPNPVTDVLYAEIGDKEFNNVTVKDIEGNIVFGANIEGSKIEINTKKWASGLYFIWFYGNNRTGSAKFLKQ